MTRSSQRGFTLVELMVVVAIIAVLAGLMFGVSPRPYDANAQVIAEQLSSTISFARTRAVSTRKIHKIDFFEATEDGLTVQIVEVSALSVTGMAIPTSPVWQLVESKRIPKSVTIWSAEPGAITTTGASPAQITPISYTLYAKPDGSATASTIYITDRTSTAHQYRVLVYHATGSSYARDTW